MLNNTTIIAITNKTCTKFPVAIPGTIPNIPSSQTIIQITATNHNRLLITFIFSVIDGIISHTVPFFFCCKKNILLSMIF